MDRMFNFVCIQILFIVFFMHIDYCKVYAEEFDEQKNKMDSLIEHLHSMYKDAFENEKTYMTRRIYTKDGNSHYTLHVQKLKEVNGIKTHNLKVEGRTKQDSPIIYINNPVEAGMPNPFLSIYEFKHALRERAENQKKEFEAKRKEILNSVGIIKNNFNQYKVHNQLNNITNKIFDVKKYTELAVKNFVRKPMKTITHKRNKKLHKRKPKVNIRSNFTSAQFIVTTPNNRTTKSPHSTIITTLPTTIADEEVTTNTKVNKGTAKTVVDKELTIESSGDGDLKTELPPNENITTESTADNQMSIGSTADDQITTVKVTKEETIVKTVTKKETITADDQLTTVKIAKEETIAETVTKKEIITADNQTTTVKVAKEETIAEIVTEKETVTADDQITTVKVAKEEVVAETVTEKETITEPVTTTTTTTTTTAKPIITTRTRQKKPYVFMGNIDNNKNNND